MKKNYKIIATKMIVFLTAILFLLLILNAILGMYPIVVMRDIIDDAVNRESYTSILFGGTVYILIQIIKSIISGGIIYIKGILNAKIALNLQMSVFKGLQYTELDKIKKLDSGKLVDSLIHDTQYIGENLVGAFSDIFSSLLSFGFGMFFLYKISGILIVIIVPMGVISSSIIKYTRKKATQNLNSQRTQAASLWNIFNEGVLAFLSIRLHEYTEEYINKITENGAYLFNIQKKQAKLESITYAFTNALFMCTIGIVMIVCSILVKKKLLSFGGLTAVLMYNHMLTDPLLVLQDANNRIIKARISLNRLSEVCVTVDQAETEEGRCANPIRKIIINGLSYAIGDKDIFKDFNLTIVSPCSVAIFGRTGCGKTTLANLISGIFSCDHAIKYLYLEGTKECPPRISYMLQDEYLFDDSVLNNILVGNPDISYEKMQEILNICSVQTIIDEHGNDPIGKNGTNLSGGERKRIQLARALADDKASVYIFDEMSASLDDQTFKKIWMDIDCYLKEKIRIYIEHNEFIRVHVDKVLDL